MAQLQPNLLQIITNALIEAEWLAQGEQPEAQDANFVLGKINDELDTWAADERYVYAKVFSLFNLVPNLSPHTIGPNNATFSLAQRPVRIDGCAIVIQNNDGTTTDLPVNTTRDADWWNFVRIKNLASQIPTDLYYSPYSPDTPNGSMYLWPIPDFAYQVRIESWALVNQFLTVHDPYVFPPAFRKALTLTVAEQLSGPRSNDPVLRENAAKAREAIWQNNAQSPTMSTMVAGMPTSEGRTRFNFLTGEPW
jgi:hypothetical protein